MVSHILWVIVGMILMCIIVGFLGTFAFFIMSIVIIAVEYINNWSNGHIHFICPR